MPNLNRRDFVKQAGIGGVGLTVAGYLEGLSTHTLAASPASNPPHHPLNIAGVHGYANQTSVASGQTIQFHVSSTVPYKLSICKLGPVMDDPAQDEVLKEFPESKPFQQPIYPGSYIHVAKMLPRLPDEFTIECWLRPWKVNAWMGVFGQFDFKRGGYGLLTNEGGGLSFHLGNTNGPTREALHTTRDGILKNNQWHHLAVTWDGKLLNIWVNGQNEHSGKAAGKTSQISIPLRIGACGDKGISSHFLDGDLSMVCFHPRSLTGEDIQRRFAAKGTRPTDLKTLLGCWEFEEENGIVVKDTSGQGRHGKIINHATWMVGGPGFHQEVSRWDLYEPAKDPSRGHALRLASDDLYDCAWKATHSFKIPSAAKPGIYTARLSFELNKKPHLYHITFIVRKGKRRTPAPILVLAATNTWRAYNGSPFSRNQPGLKHVSGTGGMANSEGNPPAYCYYRPHAAGQGTYQLGMHVPWPSAGPYILYGGPTDYSHLARADRFTHAWLEQAGYDFDVISDYDLHRDPTILSNYKIFLINGHSEYWSIPMCDGLEKFLNSGGNTIVLSGNSLFWRVSYNADGTIMECRKVDAPGNQLLPTQRGECWHSQDGQRGGMLRECGHPGWKLVGMDTLGWNDQSKPVQFGPFIVDNPDHFLFKTPLDVGLKQGDPIGQRPDGSLPRANGHEIDVRLSTLAALQELPSPVGQTVPPDPPGMTRLANGVITWKQGGAAFDYFFRPIKPKTDQGGEIIYWERKEGGRVFNAGSIGAGWALYFDPRFQKLLQNAIHHFGVPIPR